MKRIIIILGIIILIVIGFIESRSFFCVANGKYITIWKTYSKCYIIPGKYYGLLSPSANAVELGKSDVLTMFFSDSLPNTIFYKSDKPVKIINNKKEDVVLVNYHDNPTISDSLLYVKGARRNDDVKEYVQMVDIILEDNYVVDKTGKKL